MSAGRDAAGLRQIFPKSFCWGRQGLGRLRRPHFLWFVGGDRNVFPCPDQLRTRILWWELRVVP